MRLRPLTLALASALAGGSGLASAETGTPAGATELRRILQQVQERLDTLEKRNRDLEQQLQAATMGKGAASPASVPLEQRVTALEAHQEQIARSLDSDQVSQYEPDMVTRLKAVETLALSMQKQARQVEALEGIEVSGSFATLGQRVNAGATSDGKSVSELTWRGDVGIGLPGGSLGNAEGKFFAQFRLGQGSGAGNLRPAFTATTNSLGFQLADTPADNSTALLAQAWYQLDVPLPWGGYQPQSKERLEINFGKIDPFVFFDQNSIADNEAEKFLNNAFVHNPLLDSGGDIGVDSYGFSPGVRLAYVSEQGKPETWGVSLGVFGAGNGATYQRSFASPFAIAQFEYSPRLFGGLPGTYRLYAWRNGQVTGYDDVVRTHVGWGASVDQQFGDSLTAFARFGQHRKGKVQFDRAITVGGEMAADFWNRGGDTVGLALGWLRTSSDFRGEAPTLTDADGNVKFGWNATGAERIAELYYRWRINENLAISPDLQWIRQPAGDGTAPTARAAAVRALVSF